MKRAIEALAGGPVINQLIEHIHGGFEKPQQRDATPKKDSGKRRDPQRQEWVDKIVEVLRDEMFTDADRQRFKQTLPELKTYDDLKAHLEATREERVRRWAQRDQEQTAEAAYEADEPARSAAESEIPDSDPVDEEMEQAKTDDGGLF
jgi:hypothetical protein